MFLYQFNVQGSTAGQTIDRNVRFKNVCKTLAAGAMGCNPVGKFANTEVPLHRLEDSEQLIFNMECWREIRTVRMTAPLRKSLLPVKTRMKPSGVTLSRNSSTASKASKCTPKPAKRAKRTHIAHRIQRKFKRYRRFSRRNKRRRKLRQPKQIQIPFPISPLSIRSGTLTTTAKQSEKAVPTALTSSEPMLPTLETMQSGFNQTLLWKPGASLTAVVCDSLRKASDLLSSQREQTLFGGNDVAATQQLETRKSANSFSCTGSSSNQQGAQQIEESQINRGLFLEKPGSESERGRAGRQKRESEQRGKRIDAAGADQRDDAEQCKREAENRWNKLLQQYNKPAKEMKGPLDREKQWEELVQRCGEAAKERAKRNERDESFTEAAKEGENRSELPRIAVLVKNAPELGALRKCDTKQFMYLGLSCGSGDKINHRREEFVEKFDCWDRIAPFDGGKAGLPDARTMQQQLPNSANSREAFHLTEKF